MSQINESLSQFMDYPLYDVAQLQREKESLIHENEGLKILVTQLLKIISQTTDSSISDSLTKVIKEDSIQIQDLSKIISIYESKMKEPSYSTHI